MSNIDNDALDQLLRSIKNKKQSYNGLNKDDSNEESSRRMELQKVQEIEGGVALRKNESENLGFFNKMKSNKLKSEKQIEAQEVIFNNQIARLRHQAEATERQSKAYWDAKSVDFSEGLKTYAQQSMQLLENARRANKSKAVMDAYEDSHRKIKEVMERNMPDVMKHELIEKIRSITEDAVLRIEKDVIANRYNLGPEE